MTMFVALAAVMAAGAFAIVLLGARARAREVSRSAINAEVLRQQLAELERERGTDNEALREELRRRVLDDVQADMRPAGRPLRWTTFVVAALVPLAAAAIYAARGAPDLMQQAAPLNAESLEAHLASAPGDARAWVLLARLRMDADRFDDAANAYAKAIEVSPRKVAADPQVWAEYADALGMSRGGTLAGKPREAIDRALALDPRHPKALELAGSAAVEARDFRAAHAHWSALLAQLPADSPQHAQLTAAVAKLQRLAQFALPAS